MLCIICDRRPEQADVMSLCDSEENVSEGETDSVHETEFALYQNEATWSQKVRRTMQGIMAAQILQLDMKACKETCLTQK